MTPKAWLPAEQAATAKGRPGTTHAAELPGRPHTFIRAANPRLNTACVRCGRPESAHRHPELERAAFVSALDMARKAYDEQDRAYCIAQLAVATRLVKGI